jgi:carbonic anhydrase
MNKNIFSILMAIIALTLVSCHKQQSQQNIDSSFHEKSLKEHNQKSKSITYLIPGLDHVLLQSPINILSKQTETGRHNITVNYKDEISKVDNLGHTVQLDFEEGHTITIDQKTYEFKQIHFHTPAEHLIDGITYPMEMHIVNQLSGDKPEYAVIAFHFKMGEENKFIDEFLNLIPKEEHRSKEIETGIVKLRDLFGENPREEWSSFYSYKGSLTTPPYTESVRWFVVKKIFHASPDQIKKINRVEGDNARHIQGEYNRTIRQE